MPSRETQHVVSGFRSLVVHPTQCAHAGPDTDLSHAEAIRRTFGSNGGTRPRDNQRARVYRSGIASIEVAESALLGSVPEVQAIVDGILTTQWWKQRAPHRTQVRVTDGRGRRTGCSIGSEIRLPRRYRSLMSILHEMAHEWMWCPTLQGHGPEFAGAFIALVREFVGDEEAGQLAAACRINRVRVIDPKHSPSN
jgi:putative metallohydrolase (TIGR04338 family)